MYKIAHLITSINYAGKNLLEIGLKNMGKWRNPTFE